MTLRALALSAALLLAGCSPDQVQTAQDSLRTAATSAVGVLTLAQEHPELVAEGAAALNALAAKVDPKDAPTVALATAHANAGNVAEALTLTKFVANGLSPGLVTK